MEYEMTIVVLLIHPTKIFTHDLNTTRTVNTGLRSMVNFDDDKMTTNATMHPEGCCNTLCWAFCKYFNNYIVVEEDFYKIDVLEQ